MYVKIIRKLIRKEAYNTLRVIGLIENSCHYKNTITELRHCSHIAFFSKAYTISECLCVCECECRLVYVLVHMCLCL